MIEGTAKDGMGPTNLYPGPSEPTRYLLVWITKLPKESSSGRYRFPSRR